MQNTVQPYLAYRITGSSFDLGLIAFSATLPTLILALPAGVLIERMDKRKIVIAMQVIEMVQAFFLAFLALDRAHPGLAPDRFILRAWISQRHRDYCPPGHVD